MKLREIRHALWNIGFIENGINEILNNKNPQIKWVKKTINDRWFADPFILDVTDSEIILLVEEYCYNVKKGRIARLVIDRNTYYEKGYEIILECDTHLSFPFIFRQNNKVYVIPENSASGNSTLYEYNDKYRTMTPIHLLADEPFADATIFEFSGAHYLLTTKLPDTNSKSVLIYSFDKDKLKTLGRVSEVEFFAFCGRNAGEVFSSNYNLYRPAQDCTLRYGHGVIIQKISFEDGQWIFKDVNSIYPNSFRYNQGIHTLNHYKGLYVIDGRGYRNPILGRILNSFMLLIGKK